MLPDTASFVLFQQVPRFSYFIFTDIFSIGPLIKWIGFPLLSMTKTSKTVFEVRRVFVRQISTTDNLTERQSHMISLFLVYGHPGFWHLVFWKRYKDYSFDVLEQFPPNSYVHAPIYSSTNVSPLTLTGWQLEIAWNGVATKEESQQCFPIRLHFTSLWWPFFPPPPAFSARNGLSDQAISI